MSIKKSLLSVLAEHGIELIHEGSVLRAYCPFHLDQGRPNFTVYEDTDTFFCFACSVSGDKYAFVAKFEGITYAEAKSRMDGVNSIDLDEIQEKIDGVDYGEEIITTNTELNILISKMARRFMQEHSDKATQVLDYLKTVDFQLLKPVTPELMSEIVKATLQKFSLQIQENVV